MKKSVIMLLALSVIIAQPVEADYQYTFNYDTYGSPAADPYLPADSISFITSVILDTEGQTVAVPSTEDINGYHPPIIYVAGLHVDSNPALSWVLYRSESEGVPIGAVNGIFFVAQESPFAVGTYPAQDGINLYAGRLISCGDTCWGGTIQQVA